MTCALVVCAEACTPEKIRFVSQGQHLLRVDRETTLASDERVDDALKNEISRHLDACDVIILSDYAKGTLSPAVIRYAIDEGRMRDLPIVVDPKSPDFSRYARATVITPNVKEIKNATGIQVLVDEDAIAAGKAGCRAANADAVLITRAEKGMTLVPKKGTPFHCRTSAREVYDVVGAGDTVVAVVGLALAAKTSMTLATTLANVAGGLVVGRRGASTIGRSELLQHALASSKSESEQQRCKVMSRQELVKLCNTWRDAGLKVGFANGCFDILHPGHINLVTFAKSHCDRLVLAVNSDASVRRLKGSGRPVNHVDDRVAVLEALQAIDALTVFEEDTPLNLIQELMPDVLVKGERLHGKRSCRSGPREKARRRRAAVPPRARQEHHDADQADCLTCTLPSEPNRPRSTALRAGDVTRRVEKVVDDKTALAGCPRHIRPPVTSRDQDPGRTDREREFHVGALVADHEKSSRRMPRSTAARSAKARPGLRHRQPSSGACGHKYHADRTTPCSRRMASMRSLTATAASRPKYPRPIPDWLVTTTSGRPTDCSSVRPSITPRSSSTSSGSDRYSFSTISVPSRSRKTAPASII